VSKVEGKTNFSRNLKQFDGLTRLTPTPYFTTDIRHWLVSSAGIGIWTFAVFC